ncbi:MAG: PqqD family peptide modification chaperone [Planctomycetota bacterium]
MDDRQTFSQFWHRVRDMRARLRPRVIITRQRFRGRRWFVLTDPATNRFFRISPVSYELVALLDGTRTVDEVWRLVTERRGDDAPTQPETVELLGQLYQSNLLSADISPETEQLLKRGRKRVGQKVKQQAIGLMYFRLRLFNPDPILSRLEPLVRPLINKWGLLLWVALMITALIQLAPRWGDLFESVGSTLAPANWGWLAAVFVVTKLIHEFGHGVVNKSLGRRTAGKAGHGGKEGENLGQVPEFGVMMLVLFPAPYVDASSAWALPSKWHRVAVGGAGMIFELGIAAIAALVWLSTGPGELAHQIAYNAMFTASVATILFNANPLMRFDGYYMLSDLIEVPNLMSRAQEQIKHLFLKHVYRVENAQPATESRSEAAILWTYGVMALSYRVFLFISITLYVMGLMFALGLLLAIWTAVAWFVLPTGKLIHFLASSPRLLEKRGRAIGSTLAMAATLLLAIGVIPMPDRRRAAGVVESVQKTPLFVATDGFIASASVRPGDRVERGEILLVGESPSLEQQARATRAAIAETEAMMREAQASSRESAAGIARDRAETLRDQLASLQDRLDALVVRAPHDGVFVGQDPTRFVGVYARRGEAIGEVVQPESVRVTAVLEQREASWHFALGPEKYDVQIKLAGSRDRTLTGGSVEVVEAGQRRLPHAALGTTGGGTVETDPQDRSGTMMREQRFVMRIDGATLGSGEGLASVALPGERAWLRFSLPARPLLAQWADRLHKLVQGRVTL